MPIKRRRSEVEIDASSPSAPAKKPRLIDTGASRDHLSPLPSELLVRILTHLSLPQLLNVAPVSRRFQRISEDSQIWKRLYYSRFVLPRALRIPGFRDGSAREGKLHYSSRRAVWADGRRGGWVDMRSDDRDKPSRDWKKQYKLRHNWSKGTCAMEELHVEDGMSAVTGSREPQKMLVKVCDGIAVTADLSNGLRAWDLKTKQMVAQINLAEADIDAPPTCLALDEQKLTQQVVDIAVGFRDGSFGIWRLDIRDRRLLSRYRHGKSTIGPLAGVAFSHPYLLTATESILISLYTFDRPNSSSTSRNQHETSSETERDSDTNLPAPYLLTSLKSHTSQAPLALSIRKTRVGTVASIAYTFATLRGWSLGIQDLHLKPSSSNLKDTPDITTTRLAYTLPITSPSSHIPSPPNSPARPRVSTSAGFANAIEDGPISICYTHPYLLATLPDNTLILYLCTSNASSLSISPGIRLWGHTSGISDAEITARGKAVSVSCRGEEIRVWELEGRADGRSIEVRPTASGSTNDDANGTESPQVDSAFDERRNWVGFDDEMVIVLKESRGRESLMVYDFT
ncbi:hypothetical protein BKA67DRAFT_523077 [Truncatella angustata]|uniref:F-box domain-containing protein n=1 Tax=Truncatella angustata TaxID=152316 RepID=A0A9P8UEU7_9PEZI|nr:uncharacterized protein BKA67DRAFT_523077 [Truncatella angustata]KAH6648673.1 hypothetical protein BKA67DRAFT_523077 [Truncatella angustata]